MEKSVVEDCFALCNNNLLLCQEFLNRYLSTFCATDIRDLLQRFLLYGSKCISGFEDVHYTQTSSSNCNCLILKTIITTTITGSSFSLFFKWWFSDYENSILSVRNYFFHFYLIQFLCYIYFKYPSLLNSTFPNLCHSFRILSAFSVAIGNAPWQKLSCWFCSKI